MKNNFKNSEESAILYPLQISLMPGLLDDSRFLIDASASNLLQYVTLATNVSRCFPWSDSLFWFIFKKMSAKYQSLNNHNFSISCSFMKKWLLVKRRTTSRCNTNHHTNAFSKDNRITSVGRRNALCILPVSLHEY